MFAKRRGRPNRKGGGAQTTKSKLKSWIGSTITESKLKSTAESQIAEREKALL
jgi:hypothetical protein